MQKFRLKYKKGNDALLLGNGINNLTKGKTWKELLIQLDSAINLNDKPYPLAFEEIVLKKALRSNSKDYANILKNIKNEIAAFCEKIDLNDYHKQISNINVNTFLTTNYDYLIERSLGNKELKTKPTDHKYSTYRFHEIKNKKVWHIHGELDNGYDKDNPTKYKTASILIGHEHYGDYYNKIHQYLKPYDLANEVKEKQSQKECWLQYFFTHNLHIAGLSLDSSEFHLWWLLAYRARQMEQYKAVNNKIIFHYASYDYESTSANSRLQLLDSLGVKLEGIEISTKDEKKYPEYWDKFFKGINQKIRRYS